MHVQSIYPTWRCYVFTESCVCMCRVYQRLCSLCRILLHWKRKSLLGSNPVETVSEQVDPGWARWSKQMMPAASQEAALVEDDTSNPSALCGAPVAHPCLWSPSHGGCAASMAPTPPACTRPVDQHTLPSWCAPSTTTLTCTCVHAACTASSASSFTLAAACWPPCSGWRYQPSSSCSTSACVCSFDCSTSCP